MTSFLIHSIFIVKCLNVLNEINIELTVIEFK